MDVRNTKNSKKLLPKDKTNWIILLAILVVVAIFVGVYSLGYHKGYGAGEKKGKESAAKDTTSELFGNLQNPFNYVGGKVSDVKPDEITIDTTTGDRKTVKITDKTVVSRGTDTLQQGDLEKDQRVTVFTDGNKENPSATRIVINRQN